ncbi:MAG TPA: hypothetical protein VJV79_30625 [Polyangiaceae bacterium]|nr:hypothetical protein [Polyangiaceae bacterium]
MRVAKLALACGAFATFASACSGAGAPASPDGGPALAGTTSGGGANYASDNAGASSGGVSSGGASSGGASSVSGGASSGGGVSGGASSGGVSGAPPWNADWTVCTVADECTVVPIRTCCGCFSSGVNQAFAADAIASNAGFRADHCGDLGCSGPACAPDSMVVCEAGHCVARPGCSERDEQSCETDGKCQKYQARLCASPGAFAYFTCGTPRGLCDGPSTCKVGPSGQQVLFPDSCVPTGYTQACAGLCK